MKLHNILKSTTKNIKTNSKKIIKKKKQPPTTSFHNIKKKITLSYYSKRAVRYHYTIARSCATIPRV